MKCEALVTIQCSGTNPTTWTGGYVTINDPDNGFLAPDTLTAQYFYEGSVTANRQIRYQLGGVFIDRRHHTDPPVISMSVRGWRFDRSIYR